MSPPARWSTRRSRTISGSPPPASRRSLRVDDRSAAAQINDVDHVAIDDRVVAPDDLAVGPRARIVELGVDVAELGDQQSRPPEIEIETVEHVLLAPLDIDDQELEITRHGV